MAKSKDPDGTLARIAVLSALIQPLFNIFYKTAEEADTLIVALERPNDIETRIRILKILRTFAESIRNSAEKLIEILDQAILLLEKPGDQTITKH